MPIALPDEVTGLAEATDVFLGYGGGICIILCRRLESYDSEGFRTL